MKHRLILCASVLALGNLSASAGRANELEVRAVVAPGITVADLDRSLAFYRDVLTFESAGDPRMEEAAGRRTRTVQLRLGDESFELIQPIPSPGRPIPADSRANDLWFQHIAIVVEDMTRAHARLLEHGVRAISTAPQRLPAWNPRAAGIEAFYFQDPEGHPLELIHFPPDKGDPRWRRTSERLFRGIDHPAIAVADTAASLRFYRDRLGLRVVGSGENYGIEQERLSAVPGARVRITTLRAPRGPGIELLEYLNPRDGRPAPSDGRWNDLWRWRTRLALARHPRSAGPLDPRDPDGHVLSLEEAP
jgi:catechol 2,3-dioxygenase-like lactoylglutathione lyase family enzyme